MFVQNLCARTHAAWIKPRSELRNAYSRVYVYINRTMHSHARRRHIKRHFTNTVCTRVNVHVIQGDRDVEKRLSDSVRPPRAVQTYTVRTPDGGASR